VNWKIDEIPVIRARSEAIRFTAENGKKDEAVTRGLAFLHRSNDWIT
jgi:hypothetical protein